MKKLIDKMAMWHIGSIILLAVLAIIAPQQIGLLLLKAAYVTIALALGYYADRTIFARYRPFEMRKDDIVFAAVMLRRAIVVAAVVLAFAIGM